MMRVLALLWGVAACWWLVDVGRGLRQAWRLRQVHDAAYRERRGQGEEPTHG